MDLRIGASTLEIWHENTRLCSHRLLPATVSNKYSTNEADPPGKTTWQPWDRKHCEQWAERIGPDCAAVVGRLFAMERLDDQAVEPALAVLKLSKRYSAQRLDERTCAPLSHTEVIRLAVDDAHSIHMGVRIQRLVKRAGPRYPQADLRTIDLVEERRLDRSVIAGLDAGSYLEQRLNVVFR